MTGPEACIETEFGEDDDEVESLDRQLKIVGLFNDVNGRSYGVHWCCGRIIVVGDILRIKQTIVDLPSGVSEEALALTLIRGGEETCRIAFIPRFLLNTALIQCNIEKFIQVVKLFGESDNTAKKLKDRQYNGVAGCIFLDDIPSLV